MRREICAALGVAALLCAPGKAEAAAGNGQLVAVRSGSLVTFNADGSGDHVVWSTTGGPVAEPVWSPDGNRIAFINGNHVTVLELATGTVSQLTSGAVDADPGWSSDGAHVLFRRGSDLLSVPAGGGDATTLGHTADPSTASLAWASDGSIARVTRLGELAHDPLDGSGEVALADGVQGRPAVSPDASKVVVSANEGVFLDRLFLFAGDDDPVAVGGGGGNASDPAYSPDGAKLVYRRLQSLATRPDELRIVDLASASDAEIPFTGASGDSQPAWQPCVAGVTLSCTSTTPLAQAKTTFSCPAAVSVTVVAGQTAPILVTCTGPILSAEPVTQPAHGTASGRAYRAKSGFAGGSDGYTLKLTGFDGTTATVTVTITVTPKPAAPKLTVIGKPRLDRSGRVVVRLQCDRPCVLSLRVSAKLTTGRVVVGKVVKGHTIPGRTLKLTLRRGTIPKRHRVASVRIAGTATGTDGALRRNVSIALR